MSRRRRPTFRAALLLIAALLIIGGAVVTATAAPGPATDVKTAQYGGTTPPATSGPCKGVGGEAGSGCQSAYKAYKKARKACTKKKSVKQRKACLKKVKRTYPTFYGK